MENSNVVERPLLEKIHDMLERKPGTCDVAFCVGEEKKILRALKVILKASYPFLEKEFEEKWEVAVVKKGDGIPLPDFDHVAFELFVKLTSLDTWSLEILEELNLPLIQVLNLLSICRRFEITKAVGNLETLATTFLQWAEFQCKEMKVEPTQKHTRDVLGDCLFEIRFSLMTCAEFTEAREAKDVFTAEETIGIYGFIGSVASQKLKFDPRMLPFKTASRKQERTSNSKPISETNSSEPLVPPGILRLSLTRGCKSVENPPFVCDGSKKFHFFGCGKNFRVYKLGFLGPFESDGFYDVKVQFLGDGIKYDGGVLETRIFSEKGKTFYFVFDAPIDLEADSFSGWAKFYRINYWLNGANTFACNRTLYSVSILQDEGDAQFRLQHCSNQLAKILFISD